MFKKCNTPHTSYTNRNLFIVFLYLFHDPFLWLVLVPDLGLHLEINS
jgi:hypothetical protein